MECFGFVITSAFNQMKKDEKEERGEREREEREDRGEKEEEREVRMMSCWISFKKMGFPI